MDPLDPEIEPDLEETGDKESLQSRAAGIAFVVLAIILFAVAIYTGIAQTAIGLLVFPGIPLVLLWFVWHVFLRRLWRMRNIRIAQEKRELMEAALRGKETPRD